MMTREEIKEIVDYSQEHGVTVKRENVVNRMIRSKKCVKTPKTRWKKCDKTMKSRWKKCSAITNLFDK